MTRDLAAEVRAYADQVVTGALPSGALHRAACERAIRDFANPGELVFDNTRAGRAVRFVELLRHHKGEWAGKRLTLEPWQVFVVAQLFGWMRGDRRRFREVYLELPRKNGKTELAGAIALYLATADREPGAEVYCGATTTGQARIAWDVAVAMVRHEPTLEQRARIYRADGRESIVFPDGSKIAPLSREVEKMDGYNVHGAILDELHAHPTNALWQVLKTGTGSRRQPLLFGITTAGAELSSFCGGLHDRASQVSRGVVEAGHLFAMICAADPDDDWTLPATWSKANPNLGVSVKADSLAEDCQDAEQDPSQQNDFRRKRLNHWVAAASRAIDLRAWDACAQGAPRAMIEARHHGEGVCLGLDLSSTTDLTALAMAFDRPDGGLEIACRFWLPEARVYDVAASRRDQVDYAAWAEAGYLTPTPGEVVDYAWIRDEILALSRRHKIRRIGVDPWNATALASRLEEEDGFEVVQIRQGYASISDPSKQLLRLVTAGLLEHGGDPILRWMADNLVLRRDPAGNVKPDKEKSRNRIDGIVATILAIDCALRYRETRLPPLEAPPLL